MRAGATIIVGYDGSSSARRALDWAAGTVDDREAIVRAVACYGPPPAAEPWLASGRPDLTAMHADAARMLDDAVNAVETNHPTVNVERAVILGVPVEVLVHEAASSDLLVVGASGHRGVDAWRLGSVANGVVRHGTCPVAIVPATASNASQNRVAVGVDGSPASMAALRWACDEADDRDAELAVVHVWDYVYVGELCEFNSPRARDLTRIDASLQLEAAARTARERRSGPVEAILIEGGTGIELVDQAGRADLIVVGSRGRSAVRAALFGSVSQAVAAHAPCPTVIVRGQD